MVLFPILPDAGLLVLRIFLGLVMIYHGYPKLFKPAMRNQAIGGMKGMGVPMGLTVAASLIEFLGGLGLVLGLLTQLAAFFIFVEMIGTTVLSKRKMGRKFMGGYELDVGYLAMGLGLVFLGPGALSIDHLLGLI